MPTKRAVKAYWIEGRHYQAIAWSHAQPGDWKILRIDPDRPETSGRIKFVGEIRRQSAHRWQALTHDYDDRGAHGPIDRGTGRTLRQAVMHLDAREQAPEAVAARAWQLKQRDIRVTIPAPAPRKRGSATIVATLHRLTPPASGYLVYLPGHPGTVGFVTKLGPRKWEVKRFGALPFCTATRSAAVREMAAITHSPEKFPDAFPRVAAEDADDEWPEDAFTCPLLDTPVHLDDCRLCHGRGWVEDGDIEDALGPSRVPCVACGGEGGEESGGPVTWTCSSCFGTGEMPTALLAQLDLTEYPFSDMDWRVTDLSGQNLSGATFESCDFTNAIFTGADLTNTTFEECQFAGANPETASSLAGTRLQVTGLSVEQRAACAARGATVESVDDAEDA